MKKCREIIYSMQEVVCDFQRCGYRSQSGFCLNKLVKITKEGQCQTLLKPGWNNRKEEWELSTWNPWEELEPRESVKEIPEVEPEKKQDQIKDGKDGPPRD